MPTHGAAVNRGAARAGEDAMRGTMAALASIAFALAGWAASAQPYDGPPSAWTAYWEVDAFSDHPRRGPAAAKGVLFWSHGVNGKTEQYKFPPPGFVKDFARAGWDIAKVQRNNTHENGWIASGTRHVADLVERVERAHREGYARVVVAGQSYGGAISLEAARLTPHVFGVIATAPGHGTCGSDQSRLYDMKEGWLVRAIDGTRAPRVVLTVAPRDECFGFHNPTTGLRAALSRHAPHFVFLDDTMSIAGHGASGLPQFAAWYGGCLVGFLDPARAPSPGETSCPPPAQARFLFPEKFRMPAEGAVGRLSGPWSGVLATEGGGRSDGQEVCVAIETESTARGELVATVAFGPGPELRLPMTSQRRLLRRDGGGYAYAASSSSYRLSLVPDGSAALALAIVSSDGKARFAAQLRRGC